MPGSLYDRLLGCPHRRLTRPITPLSERGVPSGGTYVVCLDCGKQFAYDWDAMKIGPAIPRSPGKGVLPEDLPKARRGPIRYALLGSAIPFAFMIGKALWGKPRRQRSEEPPQTDLSHRKASE